MRTLFRSFAGGEITPELRGRIDLSKYQTGLAKCLNFEVRPHGPISNRAGMEFVVVAKPDDKKVVLLPFIFSTSQAYVLEFGEYYVRFHTLSGTVLRTGGSVAALSQSNPASLEAEGDMPVNGWWAFVTGIPELEGRAVQVSNVAEASETTYSFDVLDLCGNPIDSTNYAEYVSGGAVNFVYEIASPYAEADLPALNITQSSDVLTIAHPSYDTRELRRYGATDWSFSVVAFAPTQIAPTSLALSPNGAGSTNYEYTTTSVAADGREESLMAAAVSNPSCQALSEAGAFNFITWADAPGAVRYNTYKKINGLYGYVGQSSDGANGFRDYNITPDISQTPPELDTPISGVNNYPGAVGRFQGRVWFAGSNAKPQNVWATRSGTEANLTYSIPTRDSDAITARLTARQANRIRHLVPLGDLLALTSGAEWLINSGGNAGPITPGNIDYTPQGYSGASQVRPCVTDASVLYAQDRGGRIREILYSWEKQGYKSNDVSLMAPHLFDGYTIVSMAYARAPNPTLWCVRSDGILLGMTYIPAQQVLAWHQHDTDGLFESVAVIPEGEDDVLYAVIKRSIGCKKRYIERLHSRAFATLSDCFFVDSGLFYNGAPAATISGLWHLVGKTVSILADGAVQPQQVVSAAGTITLTHAASKVAVGLPIRADAQTLPLAWETEAFAQGTNKNVNKVFLNVLKTTGLKVGPTFDKLRAQTPLNDSPYVGGPPQWRTGVIPVVIDPTWSREAPICIRQDDPLPATILGLVPDTASGG